MKTFKQKTFRYLADKVTGISGRGVGMDIVKDQIEKLGGEIRIETEQGKFTMFSIAVPR